MSSSERSFELIAGGLTVLVVLWFVCRAIMIDDVLVIPGRKRHNWKSVKIIGRAAYCSICEIFVVASTGLVCDSCGVCSHPHCTKKADSHLKCKDKYLKNGKSISHHWVKGNLPLNMECSLCKEDIDYHASPGLFGYRCCWCQTALHTNCFKKYATSDPCNYGRYRELIIPPTSIVAARTRRAVKLHLTGINPPDWEDWKPLLIIANTKSGSNTASDVVSHLRGYLHPLQVMELCPRGPQEALQWAVKISPKQCRILVAGGDGTVGWVLNTIFALDIRPIPEISIMPLGTGNDLSRVMRWGAESPDHINPVEILDQILASKVVNLDRWVLEIESVRYRLPIQRASLRTVYVYNYFSVGVDAQVTLNFHKTRDSRFYVLSSRLFNKILYFCFGTHQIMQPECEGLEKRIELYLDNKKVDLPELQSVVFLNIDSWGAGVKLCELSNKENKQFEHSISDGKMEVFGIVSSFHIAQLQVGIGKPVRIGQAKRIKIKFHQSCPVQADGEPWVQQQCEMSLSARGQAKMLQNQTESTT
ncbi:unnamed protein product [Hermetia illucens]|uniref:Diacylglycerol kinase n=1 Tax=Hermetia illucens TaxID=343691 RepID=A0A7R8U9W3_HERIL|nr:diacylglycerol kinase epsilon [Hermetia illucens]CAD7076868.1 unnamed protein product [Hermetia illucens]